MAPQNDDIVLNLDALEREQKDVKPDFVVTLGGRKITFADPATLDWRDLAEWDSPQQFIEKALTAEDLDFVLEQKIPGWKFRTLWESYQNHFGLDSQGNAGA